MKARLEKSKDEWVENLPSVLWAYHTMSRIPTSEMLYSLVYGTKLVILVKIGMPSFRTLNLVKENNKAELRLNLDLLAKKREQARVLDVEAKMDMLDLLFAQIEALTVVLGSCPFHNLLEVIRGFFTPQLLMSWQGPPSPSVWPPPFGASPGRRRVPPSPSSTSRRCATFQPRGQLLDLPTLWPHFELGTSHIRWI
ncbi:hypothetical protein Acr_16g0001010 [Actinidia rufa]|uniref:Uncharacterized protein n=1 Tax=Actinidia rufa TaxID=165716 RepID=A0A7J0FYD6_9ERIC|nr:hypothetical protein Acr_16g0001010 [Actinidia rufa]